MSGQHRARWGWYRLADQFASSLVEISDIGAGDLVLDLGAGAGAITRHLVARGARVIAFELHPERAAVLRDRFAEDTRVKVVRADISDLRLPARTYHVVANPPFASVSAVIAQLTSRRSALGSATLIVPVSVAVRWQERLARHGSLWRLRVGDRLPRSAFTPRPRVDCCVVVIDRR